jgi:hypothetical protein
MGNVNRVETDLNTDHESDLEELTDQEAAQVGGTGPLRSPLGAWDTLGVLRSREIVEDVEAY